MSSGEKLFMAALGALYAGSVIWLFRDDKRLNQEREAREEAERRAHEAIGVITAAVDMLPVDMTLKFSSSLDAAAGAQLDQLRARFKDAVQTLEEVKPQVDGFMVLDVQRTLDIAQRIDIMFQ
jgi:hypothetical protein